MIKLSVLIAVWNQEKLVVKCLDSVPRRDDIEVIVCDDGSTDGTLAVLRKYKKEHPELALKICYNKANRGAAYTFNRIMSMAQGEYFHFIGSDDYLYTDEYSRAVDAIGGADVAVFDIDRNDGVRCFVTEANGDIFCGNGLRFFRKKFVEGIKYPEDKVAGSDWYFYNDVMARKPRVKYLGILAYHYNFPREGSLSYRNRQGEFDG